MDRSLHEIAAWYARIGIAPPVGSGAELLAALHRAQRLAIPFENLDIRLGRGISLQPDAVFAKLVTAGRGGYCFEQNALFRTMLVALGFTVRPLLARVWLGLTDVQPRTHTLILVTLDGTDWIADAGFGGAFTPVMPLVDGQRADTADGARHRLARDAEHGWMLSRDAGAGWVPQYSFTLEPVFQADLDMSNHWTATVPGGRFTTLAIANIALPAGYASLTDRRYVVHDGGRTDEREIGDPADWRALLADRFGLALTPGEVAQLGLFPAP